MEFIISLWLPIVLSAIAVFIISSVLHTVFTYHNSDFKIIPSEDQIMEDLRKYNIPPGDYMIPFSSTIRKGTRRSLKRK